MAPDHTKKPSGSHWPGLYKDKDTIRNRLADWLLNGNWSDNSAPPKEEEYEYEGYDGFYNNIAVPDLGAIGKTYFTILNKC